jgi:mannose-6-phosphate isomerase-like protein (cupin superfamily)
MDAFVAFNLRISYLMLESCWIILCSARVEMKTEKINLLEKFEKLPAGDYAVGLIAEMNDYEFKIVKFKGDFVWHSHPETDETFIILEGELVMTSGIEKCKFVQGR